MTVQSTVAFRRDQCWDLKGSSLTLRIWWGLSRNTFWATTCMLKIYNWWHRAHLTINDIPSVATRLQNCIKAIQAWCNSKWLQLNPTKTELIWFGSRTNLPDDATEGVAEHSSRLQPSINLHAPVTAFMFSCSGTQCTTPKGWRLG